jgi:hypothetical protein
VITGSGGARPDEAAARPHGRAQLACVAHQGAGFDAEDLRGIAGGDCHGGVHQGNRSHKVLASWLNLDVELMLTGLRAIAGHLQPQPRLRAA